MDKKTELHRKRMRRKLKASIFFRRNGLYITIAVCLAMIGGISTVILSGKPPVSEAPAEHSLDERLNEAVIETFSPTQTPAIRPTANPHRPIMVPDETVIPDMTPSPSETPAPRDQDIKWTSPVDGRLIRSFAMDCLIYSKTLGQWMTHSGVDIAAPKGTEVRSVDAGSVKRVYDDDMLGTTVVIEHRKGLVTVYSGLKKETLVKEGDSVSSRDLIGYIGDTAISECAEESHLHFEVWKEEKPVDPKIYITFKTTE